MPSSASASPGSTCPACCCSQASSSASTCCWSTPARTRRIVFSDGATRCPLVGLRRAPARASCFCVSLRPKIQISVTFFLPFRRAASTITSTVTSGCRKPRGWRKSGMARKWFHSDSSCLAVKWIRFLSCCQAGYGWRPANCARASRCKG